MPPWSRTGAAGAVGDFGPVTAGRGRAGPFFEMTASWPLDDGALYGNLRARGALALPKRTSGLPGDRAARHRELSGRVFGFGDDSGIYRSLAGVTAEEGMRFAVQHHRGRAAQPLPADGADAGQDALGLEIAKIAACSTTPAPTAGRSRPRRVLGISWAVPARCSPRRSKRIKVAIPYAWFNHRVRKMVIDDRAIRASSRPTSTSSSLGGCVVHRWRSRLHDLPQPLQSVRQGGWHRLVAVGAGGSQDRAHYERLDAGSDRAGPA